MTYFDFLPFYARAISAFATHVVIREDDDHDAVKSPIYRDAATTWNALIKRAGKERIESTPIERLYASRGRLDC